MGTELLLRDRLLLLDDDGPAVRETGLATRPYVSATEPDWSRERLSRRRAKRGGEVGKHLLRCVRGYQAWRGRPGWLARGMRKFYAVKWRLWSTATASEVSLDADLGGGLMLPHPQGVVVHPRARIGPNCMLFQGVTLGTGGPKPGVPVLGGHVDVGCGAKLLGGIRVGDHAKIGANAVVLCDVPPGRTAVGVPARVV